jgi:alkaline phosphatase
MQHDDDRASDVWGEPSLAEMVSKSIDILQRGPAGYFLYVEGNLMSRTQAWYDLYMCVCN